MRPWWNEAVGNVAAGRRVVIAGAVPAAWNDHVDVLRAVGVDDVMIYATEGAGAGGGPDVHTVVIEPPRELDNMASLRFGIDALVDPPEHVRAALDRFDPDATAVVLGSFLNPASELAGRPFVAHRRPEWIALEDKTVIDAFWDRAGVDRLPSVVTTLTEAPTAAAALDRGDGTVWAGDVRDGFHGGAANTCWVADDESRDRALDHLATSCDRVRIMPFIDGIPCSIHGVVLADGVAVLRPVEMVTLRRGHEFVYAGCATFWDPPEPTRDTMRWVARRVGERLDAEVAFRGAFTVDGVIDVEAQFWPTELNPRFGAGLNVIARAADPVPLMLINDLIVGGHPAGVMASEFETELLTHADRHRSGGTWTAARSAAKTVADKPIRFDGTRWTFPDEEPGDRPGGAHHADGLLTVGPTVVRCRFRPERTPIGPSVGSRAAAFYEFCDCELGTDLGQLTAAPAADR